MTKQLIWTYVNMYRAMTYMVNKRVQNVHNTLEPLIKVIKTDVQDVNI